MVEFAAISNRTLKGCALSGSTLPSAQADVLRKQSWRGMKAPIKRLVSLRLPHMLLRGAIRIGRLDISRLPAPAYIRKVRAETGGTHFVMLAPDRCILAKELYWSKGKPPLPRDQLALDAFAALANAASFFSRYKPDLTARGLAVANP